MVAFGFVQRNSLLALIGAAATWRSTVSITLPSSLKTTTSNRHLGATAELNEAGYQQILSTGSNADLTAFATRVLDAELLSVDEPHHLDLITALREASMGMAKTFAEFKEKLVEKIVAIKEKVVPSSLETEAATNAKVAPASHRKKEATEEKVAPASHKKEEAAEEKVAPASNKKEERNNNNASAARKHHAAKVHAANAAREHATKPREQTAKADRQPRNKEASKEKVAPASHKKEAPRKELVGSATPVVNTTNTTANTTTGGDSTTATPACPDGYDVNDHNLQDSTGLKSTADDLAHCAKTCCARDGCTSFEFGTTSKYAGCWTYTGGDASIKYGKQAAGWTSCIKKDDPGACAASACPHGYQWISKNLAGDSGLKSSTEDVDTCRDQCCQREGCTSFEVGATTKYKGCWTYADGAADIKWGGQLSEWTSCLRQKSTACPNSSYAIPEPVSEQPVNSSEPGTEPVSEPNSSEPASEPASASGDPHLINTRGERFDIFKTGQIEFLRVPYDSVSGNANFTLLATIQNTRESTVQCDESRYITSLLFDGAWFGGQPLDVTMDHGQMVVRLGGVQVKPSPQPRTIGNMLQLHMSDEDQIHLDVGETRIHVSSDIQPVHYFLNMLARSLGSLGSRIGGLLGEDDHVAVSTPPSGCTSKFASLTASGGTRHSRASARMTP